MAGLLATMSVAIVLIAKLNTLCNAGLGNPAELEVLHKVRTLLQMDKHTGWTTLNMRQLLCKSYIMMEQIHTVLSGKDLTNSLVTHGSRIRDT